jgi:perosamine synthetase
VPHIVGNEWSYIRECLDTNWVSSAGPFVERFEREMAKRVGTEHAVATVNGTAALHIALLVAGVEPDDEVLISDLTFIAPANAIRYVGAVPVFIDAEPDHWQMDPDKALKFLREQCQLENSQLRNRKTGRRVSAILPVHILGHPVDTDPLLEAAEEFGLRVIEDATEALGAECRGRRVGALGHIACFSFNGNKIITTGGGGMIVTDNGEWAQRAKYLTTQAKDDPLEYVHRSIGYNYRLTNIQAAMGCAQLERLDEHIAAKRRIADSYREQLADLPGVTPMREAPWALSIHWLFTILVDPQRAGADSRVLLSHLREAGIQTRPLWQPMHLSPAHAGCVDTGCPVAERLNCEALSLPSSVGLTPEQQGRVVAAIREAL